MRPLRLEVEGFTSYREPTVVDFADTDLLVFTGATGSGKSSLIDAMIFALYGSVPRYDHASLIAPVISQGKVRARVRLDFEARGRSYTAVRVVQRTTTGATTREARLEEHVNGQPVKTLAATESDLSARVQSDVIGLALDHFTKCVVLPQGEFAAFLRAKPAERKQLLERLLGLGLYERLRKAANLRWKLEEGRADNLQWQLDSALAHATPEAVGAAEARIKVLDRLRRRVDEVATQLNDLDSKIRAATERWTRAETQSERLAEVRVPDGTAELATRHREAERNLRQSTEAWTAAAERLRGARSARDELPEKAAIEKVVENRDQLALREREIAQTRRDLEVATATVAEAVAAEQAIQDESAQVRRRLKELPERSELENLGQRHEQLRQLEGDLGSTRREVAEAEQAYNAAVAAKDRSGRQSGSRHAGSGSAPHRPQRGRHGPPSAGGRTLPRLSPDRRPTTRPRRSRRPGRGPNTTPRSPGVLHPGHCRTGPLRLNAHRPHHHPGNAAAVHTVPAPVTGGGPHPTRHHHHDGRSRREGNAHPPPRKPPQ